MPYGNALRTLSACLVLAMTSAVSSSQTSAASCPALDGALRLIRVSTADMNTAVALLETFERPSTDAPWQPVGALREAVVGLKGLAWGGPWRHLAREGEPLKQEGDKRSPAGLYALGAPFGFEPSSEAGYLQLVTDQHICVEDVRSELYGQIVSRTAIAPGIKFDQMRAEPLYRAGLVVDYPPDRERKAGSCIFIHVWRKPGQGTAGCVAMDEANVTEIRAWASALPTAIAILPSGATERFAGCLP